MILGLGRLVRVGDPTPSSKGPSVNLGSGPCLIRYLGLLNFKFRSRMLSPLCNPILHYQSWAWIYPGLIQFHDPFFDNDITTDFVVQVNGTECIGGSTI